MRVHFIKWNIFEAFFNFLKGLATNGLPLQCAIFKSKKFSKKTKEIFKNNNINAIYCVMIRVVPNINWFKGKLLIEMIDSMGLNFLRRYQTTTGLKKWIFKIEQKKLVFMKKN